VVRIEKIGLLEMVSLSKPSQGRGGIKRELKKLMLAHSDVHGAYSTCELFLKIFGSAKAEGPYGGMDDPLYRPLIEAIIISYARPFTENKSFGGAKKGMAQVRENRIEFSARDPSQS
jgi:hypothetical protein